MMLVQNYFQKRMKIFILSREILLRKKKQTDFVKFLNSILRFSSTSTKTDRYLYVAILFSLPLSQYQMEYPWNPPSLPFYSSCLAPSKPIQSNMRYISSAAAHFTVPAHAFKTTLSTSKSGCALGPFNQYGALPNPFLYPPIFPRS